MLFKCAIVYLDDILLMSCDFPEHYKYLEMLIHKFKANLRMNGKKCSFAKDELKYIGHILSKHGVQIDPSKTDVNSSWPRLKSVKHIRSFWVWLIFTSDMLTIIHNVQHHYGTFCRRVYLLNMRDAQEKAFQDLKSALWSPPILRFPDTSRPYFLQTDASLHCVSKKRQ